MGPWKCIWKYNVHCFLQASILLWNWNTTQRTARKRNIKTPFSKEIWIENQVSLSFVLLQNFAFPDLGPESGHLMIHSWWRKTIQPWVCMCGAGGMVRSRERNYGPKRGQKLSRKYIVSPWHSDSLTCKVSVFHSIVPPPSNYPRFSGVTVKPL